MSLQYEHIEITNLSPTKINPSVCSFQALLEADSKDWVGLERMTTDFFHITSSEQFSEVNFLTYLLTCSLSVTSIKLNKDFVLITLALRKTIN